MRCRMLKEKAVVSPRLIGVLPKCQVPSAKYLSRQRMLKGSNGGDGSKIRSRCRPRARCNAARRATSFRRVGTTEEEIALRGGEFLTPRSGEDRLAAL